MGRLISEWGRVLPRGYCVLKNIITTVLYNKAKKKKKDGLSKISMCGRQGINCGGVV